MFGARVGARACRQKWEEGKRQWSGPLTPGSSPVRGPLWAKVELSLWEAVRGQAAVRLLQSLIRSSSQQETLDGAGAQDWGWLAVRKLESDGAGIQIHACWAPRPSLLDSSC